MLSKEFFESVYKSNNKKIHNESIIRRYLYYCRDCSLSYYAGSDEPKPCPCCGKENKILEVEETYWG